MRRNPLVALTLVVTLAAACSSKHAATGDDTDAAGSGDAALVDASADASDAGATCGPIAATDPGAPTDTAARITAVLARVAAAQTTFEHDLAQAKSVTVRSYMFFALYDAVLATTHDDTTAKADSMNAAFTYQCYTPADVRSSGVWPVPVSHQRWQRR